MRTLTKFGSLALASVMMTSLVACSTPTKTINTADIAADAQAVAYLAKTIIAIPDVANHAPPAVLAQLQASVDRLADLTAQISSQSNGAITIDTSKTWANSLISEIKTFVDLAQPIVAQYSPKSASYLNLASEMLPFIQAIVTAATGTTSATLTPVVSPKYHLTEGQLRSQMYIQSTAGLSAADLRKEIYAH